MDQPREIELREEGRSLDGFAEGGRLMPRLHRAKRLVPLVSALATSVLLAACGGTHTGRALARPLAYAARPKPPLAERAVSLRRCGVIDPADESAELVPQTPCAIRLTLYSELLAQRGEALRPIAERDVRSVSLVRRLTREFDALPPPSVGASTFACPNDDGSQIKAILQYRDRRSLPLTIGLTGCPKARRGALTRSALGHAGEELIGQLERLTARS